MDGSHVINYEKIFNAVYHKHQLSSYVLVSCYSLMTRAVVTDFPVLWGCARAGDGRREVDRGSGRGLPG